jgi:hypothetical protein
MMEWWVYPGYFEQNGRFLFWGGLGNWALLLYELAMEQHMTLLRLEAQVVFEF